MSNFPECFGGLFPDLIRLQDGGAVQGKTFTALVASCGQLSHKLEMKREECEKCAQCPEYRTCYDFSLAKLLMNAVLMQTLRMNPWVRS